MKKTIDSAGFVKAFEDCGRAKQFTRAGLRALFDHIEDMERDTGEELELDPIGLCSEFAEYETARKAANFTDWQPEEGEDEEAQEESALDYIQGELNAVIEFDGGVIVSNH